MRTGDVDDVVGNVPQQLAMLTAASRQPQVASASLERNHWVSARRRMAHRSGRRAEDPAGGD
jgi:hypothetical protein